LRPRDVRKYLYDIAEAAALAKRVSDYQKIFWLRNILIHGYADVDDEVVWDIVETRLPILRNEIAQIIGGK
jgi:uncharacterized protein with HEPN domain